MLIHILLFFIIGLLLALYVKLLGLESLMLETKASAHYTERKARALEHTADRIEIAVNRRFTPDSQS